MPFSLGELVNMSQHLRDISLGLVELAFPDSRPAVREDYRWEEIPAWPLIGQNTGFWLAVSVKCIISFLYFRIAVNSVKKEKLAEVEAEEDVRVWSNLFRSDLKIHNIWISC